MKGAGPFSKPERMIATRYLRAKKNEGGVALIAAISFACITLAIAAMIIIMSIMNGFRAETVRLILGSEGHIFVQPLNELPCGPTPNALEQSFAQLPDVKDVHCYSQDFAGLQANGRISGGQVNGIRPADLQQFDIVREGMILGSLDTFGQGQGGENQVLIGIGMANQLGLTVGDRITVYSGRTRSTIAGTVPIIKPYTIGGVFETGVFQSDLTTLYMSLDQATLLFNEGRPATDILLRLNDIDLVDDVRPQLQEIAGDTTLFIGDWRDRNASIATALRTEQVVMRMIFGIVVIIATFPVLAAMIMLVKNKSRDIAILRTIGATKSSVLRIFFMTGAMIGILGTIVGLILGILFCLNLGPIQAVLEAITGRELFPAEAYQLSGGIPARIVWSEIAMVAGWGVFISFLATLLPALSASRTDPVDALRYE
jgi:lipoprotein-releasing system permease protein